MYHVKPQDLTVATKTHYVLRYLESKIVARSRGDRVILGPQVWVCVCLAVFCKR